MAWLYNSTAEVCPSRAAHAGLTLGQNLVDSHPIPFGWFVVTFWVAAAVVMWRSRFRFSGTEFRSLSPDLVACPPIAVLSFLSAVLLQHILVHMPKVPDRRTRAAAILHYHGITLRDRREFRRGQSEGHRRSFAGCGITAVREFRVPDSQNDHLALRQKLAIAGELDLHARLTVGKRHRLHALDRIGVVGRRPAVERGIRCRQGAQGCNGGSTQSTIRRQPDVGDVDLVLLRIIKRETHAAQVLENRRAAEIRKQNANGLQNRVRRRPDADHQAPYRSGQGSIVLQLDRVRQPAVLTHQTD